MSAQRVAVATLLVIGGTLATTVFMSELVLFIILAVLIFASGIIASKKTFGGTVSLCIILIILILVLDAYYLHVLHGLEPNTTAHYISAMNSLPLPSFVDATRESIASLGLPEFARDIILHIVASYPLFVVGSMAGSIGGYIGEKIAAKKGSEKEVSAFFEG
ncbi:MAG: hypothetical protein QXL15_02680 [Candidatus Korarchaeota archaeon]